jgi:RHS repeat-associated protein
VSLQGAGGIGGLLARSSGYSSGNWTSHADYYADGNGNVTSLIDGNQAVVASYRYDPFGNIISKSGTLANANVYRFSSKEVHVNSGMYYYGFRFYDPNLQRWINADPLGDFAAPPYTTRHLLSEVEFNPATELNEEMILEALTQANGNLHTGIGNNPINKLDPDGLILGNIVAGIFGGAVDLGLQLVMNRGRLDCVSWVSVGISAVATGAGYGLVATMSKLGKLGRAARVLEKVAEKSGPLTNYWKAEAAAAKAAQNAAKAAVAASAATQAAKYLVKESQKHSTAANPPNPNGKPDCPK